MLIELRKMELLLLVMAVLSVSYMSWPCLCTGVCSSQDFGLSKDGAFHFPVFHRKHPCVDDSSSTRVCQNQWREAGQQFDPENSTTYRHVGCSDEDYCVDIHQHSAASLTAASRRRTDTCLYLVLYGSSSQHYYTAGKVGKDRLSLGSGNSTIADDFVFGCSEDDKYEGHEAGVIGFGNKSFSFFNQMARQTSYNAFAYCFPGDHRAEGFLIVGPYPRKPESGAPHDIDQGIRA